MKHKRFIFILLITSGIYLVFCGANGVLQKRPIQVILCLLIGLLFSIVYYNFRNQKNKVHILIQKNEESEFYDLDEKFNKEEKILYEYNGLANLIRYDKRHLLFEDEKGIIHLFNIRHVDVSISLCTEDDTNE